MIAPVRNPELPAAPWPIARTDKGKDDVVLTTHRPYPATQPIPAARARDRFAAAGAVLIMAAILAALVFMGVN